MKIVFPLLLTVLVSAWAAATTITVVAVYEPLSLHGTDGDEAISDTGEALQACVMPRPMALSGAFPEDIVEAIRTPHAIPTNNDNYKVREANLLVLCNIGIKAHLKDDELTVELIVAEMNLPEEIDLTTRQILKLVIVAVRKTTEAAHEGQARPMHVLIRIDEPAETPAAKSLADLSSDFTLKGSE